MIYIYMEILYIKVQCFVRKMEQNVSDQSGQTLVEFVLLLCVLMLTSLIFLSTVNKGTASIWLTVGKILTEDPTQVLSIR